MALTTVEIGARVAQVQHEISLAAERAGRPRDAVRLIAVTKTFPTEVLRAAYAAGVRRFGENYPVELGHKASELGWADVEWHQIGPVQRRAVARLPRDRLVVHTLDRLELIERFVRVMPDSLPKFLVQVNIGLEPQKAGIAPGDLERLLDDCASAYPQARIVGLMTIPPVTPTAEGARPYFAKLRDLGDRLAARLGHSVELSMGMSNDFAVAIAEGATMVRVGSRIFGPRPERGRTE